MNLFLGVEPGSGNFCYNLFMEPKGSETLKGSESINDKLRAVLTPLQTLINQSEIPEEDGKRLELDEKSHEINSVYSGFGRFSFKGGVEPEGFYAELPQEPTAVIRNIRIPSKLRGRGLGPKIVGAWEEGLSGQGVRVFTAVNIKDKLAMDFWRKLGYQIPQGESHKAIPYCMYKEIPPAPVPEPILT